MTTPDRPVMTEEEVRGACFDIKKYVLYAKKRGYLYPTGTRDVEIICDLAIEALRKRENHDQ